MTKSVYSFNEGFRGMHDILGTKGANLAEMTGIGLPVPFGFIISTDACRRFFEENLTLGKDLEDAIYEKIEELENVSGKIFGSAENPLLVSVRSSSPVPMPGIMDTLLNLGLNDETVNGLAALTGSRRFALDTYRRFIQMYGTVVLDIPKAEFDLKLDTDEMSEDELETVIERYKETVKNITGKEFTQDPKVQLTAAVKAIFRSWKSDHVAMYRKMKEIPDATYVAVIIQSMVFGNMGPTSGTGVAFTRNPYTGEKELQGKFLVCAQGEDVSTGLKTPLTIEQMEESFPDACKVLTRISELLEKHYKDMQDMEFTIENNKLYMLQTRDGMRSAQAAVKIAVDMTEEGLIDKKTAITRVAHEQIDQLLGSELCSEYFAKLLEMADEIRGLRIRTNVESPKDAVLAIEMGADGIGLCGMGEGLPAQEDYRELFRLMGERRVTFLVASAETAKEQVENIFRAALQTKAEDDTEPVLEFVAPLKGTGAEFAEIKKIIAEASESCKGEADVPLNYTVGAMIRTPRETLTADKIAEEAEFFLFDTKTLTCLTFGVEDGACENWDEDADPFRTIDISGVGSLIRTACQLGHQTRPRLRTGICGEHGGDPESIRFCHSTGMNYVSCPLNRVPAARLAAAVTEVCSADK